MHSQHRSDLYPIQLSVVAREKVWGGQKISGFLGHGVPADRPIGEAWVVWDQLAVANGAWQGMTLADLVRDHRDDLLGSRLAAGEAPGFPLLVKFVDARETLSVQVHPDDRYARERVGEPFGKAEAWYFLDVEPGASLIHGVRSPLTRADAAQAIASGTLRTALKYIDVAPGDLIMNPPGTIHALGEGVFLYELQQSSDLTFRLYDWDRNDPARALHVEQSLDVADLDPLTLHTVHPVELLEPGGSRAILCACRHFVAELLTVVGRVLQRPGGVCFHILTVLRGAGWLRYGDRPAQAVELHPGESLLVPAGIQQYEIGATDGRLALVKAYVPDLVHDVVTPLRAAGVPNATIAQLGGDPRRSDLGQYAGR